MWVCLTKKVIRLGTPVVRLVSNFADDLAEGVLEAKKVFLQDKDHKKNIISLKIAISGLPNVGKSTLINNLIGKPICAASSKAHTTRSKSISTFNSEDVQLVFVDTPGLVNEKEQKKYKLENTFMTDTPESFKEVDIIGVVQDVTHLNSRESIDKKLIHLLKLYQDNVNTILIINKVDKLKNKKLLLEIVDNLTKKDVWPHFSDIFMISALTGDGVNDLRNYLLDSAKFINKLHPEYKLTDQPNKVIFKNIIKARLLDELPQEIPYQLDVDVEHIDYSQDNNIHVIAEAKCASLRIARLIIGKTGNRIKEIAKRSEQDLCAIFQTNVRLKIIVPMNNIC